MGNEGGRRIKDKVKTAGMLDKVKSNVVEREKEYARKESLGRKDKMFGLGHVAFQVAMGWDEITLR